jgi:hypothetical protein
MLKAYINYPNPHIKIHGDAGCADIRKQHKEGQRLVRLDIASLSTELNRFKTKYYSFGSAAVTNDMWLEADFADPAFERAVVEYVRKLLAENYTPFGQIGVEQHCRA